VHNVSDARWIEPLVPGPSRLEIEIAVAMLKTYKLAGSDEILAELVQAGGETLLSAIHKLINSVSNEEELPDQWKESIIVPVRKKHSLVPTEEDARGFYSRSGHCREDKLYFLKTGI
jgi:hypothetical protein